MTESVSQMHLDPSGLLELAPDAMVLVGTDGRIAMVNQQAERLFGYDREELIGRDVETLLPERLRASHARFRDDYFAAPRIREMGPSLKLVGQRRDGTEFPADVRLGPVQLGDSILVAGAIRDLSASARDEHRWRRMAIALGESNAALRASQARLLEAARLETVGRLAAGVAHEIKNPLGVLSLGLALVRSHPLAEDGELAEVLRDMGQAVARADTVVKGLLDFAVPRPLAARRRPLETVVRKALALVSLNKVCVGIAIVEDLGSELPDVEVDEGRAAQVLVNVLLNAAEAMDGRGTLTVRTLARSSPRPFAQSGPEPADAWVVCEVDDTGPGLSDETLERVFDPFFSDRATGARGAGLGLTVSRQLVEQHGGWIEISNRPEGGARVTIAYPAVR